MPMLGLPAACYLDPAAAARERERIFDGSWQFVCHTSDLPAAGTAIRFDHAGRSSVLLRGADGALHGFLNACRHRGSRLVDGDAHTGLAFCVGARLRCQYHGWTYDASGALVEVPAAQQYRQLDYAGTTLRRVHVDQWRGLVFVAFEQPARSLAEELDHCVPAMDAVAASNLRRLVEPRTYAVGADWKLACEHLLDVSHLAIARPALKPHLFAPPAFNPCGSLAMRAVSEVAGAAPWWPARAYARWLPEQLPRTAEFLFLWPNLLLLFAPEQLAVIQVLPGATGACTVREVAYGMPDATREVRLARYLHERMRRRARVQDSRIVERVQDGLASAGPASEGGPLATEESALRWFVERLRAAGAGGDPVKPSRRRRARGAALAMA
jgi:carnitine monooxygenase subunit